MKQNKQNSTAVLKNLIDYLIISLEEINQVKDLSQFSEGEVIAFVECLEITSKWTKYHKYGIIDIEKHFPVK